MIHAYTGYSFVSGTYGPLAPGHTSHCKFVDDFLKTCSVSHSFITRLGWFRSSIYELAAGSCPKKMLGVSGKLLNFTFFFVENLGGNTMGCNLT